MIRKVDDRGADRLGNVMNDRRDIRANAVNFAIALRGAYTHPNGSIIHDWDEMTYDPAGMWDATDPSKLTFSQAGIFEVIGTGPTYDGGVVEGANSCELLKNGSVIATSGKYLPASIQINVCRSNFVTLHEFAVGDYLQMRTTHGYTTTPDCRGEFLEVSPLVSDNYCKYNKTSSQSIADGTVTGITLSSTAEFDVGGFFNGATPDRLIAPVTGYYSVSGFLRWQESGGPPGIRISWCIRVSDSLVVAINEEADAVPAYHWFCSDVELAAGDALQLRGFQNSGSAINVESASLMMYQIA